MFKTKTHKMAVSRNKEIPMTPTYYNPWGPPELHCEKKRKFQIGLRVKGLGFSECLGFSKRRCGDSLVFCSFSFFLNSTAVNLLLLQTGLVGFRV